MQFIFSCCHALPVRIAMNAAIPHNQLFLNLLPITKTTSMKKKPATHFATAFAAAALQFQISYLIKLKVAIF
ncbi:hypothetical protein LK994_03105 [Ferruginibacter lapsinanis]|nr:hypothetical protein [Ferruginibacter lapsinanis]UEG50463.1 hypothetical protein LK994_03105 [Ferruginibacter lapsinanis]